MDASFLRGRGFNARNDQTPHKHGRGTERTAPAASNSPRRPRLARWRAEPATRRRASAWPSRTRAGRRHPTTRLNKGVPHPTCTLQRSQTSRRLVDAANGGQ